MRTLDELMAAANSAASAYKTRKDAAKKEYDDVILAAENAKTAQEKAISDGDESAFEAAKKAEGYNRERAKMLSKIQVDPFYSKDEYNKIIGEIRAAFKVECAGHYQRINELMAEIVAEEASIEQFWVRANHIEFVLEQGSGRPLKGRESAGYDRFNDYPNAFIRDLCRNYTVERETIERRAKAGEKNNAEH